MGYQACGNPCFLLDPMSIYFAESPHPVYRRIPAGADQLLPGDFHYPETLNTRRPSGCSQRSLPPATRRVAVPATATVARGLAHGRSRRRPPFRRVFIAAGYAIQDRQLQEPDHAMEVLERFALEPDDVRSTPRLGVAA
jgi:hypothetical protein